MPQGRPTIYTPELGNEICARLADGESLRGILQGDEMPNKSTVMRWLFSDKEELKDFCDQYARAREMQAELMADEMMDIADDGTNDWMTRRNKDGSEYEVVDNEAIQRSKLRIDARKWVASKLLPKKYGERTRHEHTGPGGGPMEFYQSIQPTTGPPSERS